VERKNVEWVLDEEREKIDKVTTKDIQRGIVIM